MTVADIVEVSATSEQSLEDAIVQGIQSVGEGRVNFVKSAWVKEQRVDVEAGRIIRYQVNLLLTIVGEEHKPPVMGP